MDRLTFWFSCSRLSRRQIILENVACFLAVSTSEIAVQTLCSLLFFVLIARLDVSFWKLLLPLHFAVWNWKAGRHQSYISQVSKYSKYWLSILRDVINGNAGKAAVLPTFSDMLTLPQSDDAPVA